MLMAHAADSSVISRTNIHSLPNDTVIRPAQCAGIIAVLKSVCAHRRAHNPRCAPRSQSDHFGDSAFWRPNALLRRDSIADRIGKVFRIWRIIMSVFVLMPLFWFQLADAQAPMTGCPHATTTLTAAAESSSCDCGCLCCKNGGCGDCGAGCCEQCPCAKDGRGAKCGKSHTNATTTQATVQSAEGCCSCCDGNCEACCGGNYGDCCGAKHAERG